MSQFSSVGGRSPRLVEIMELWVVSLILTPIQVGFVVAFMSMVVCSE